MDQKDISVKYRTKPEISQAMILSISFKRTSFDVWPISASSGMAKIVTTLVKYHMFCR
jgi:hypothetical protein